MKKSAEEPKKTDIAGWYYDAEESGSDSFRYALGEKGSNPLVVFGINPSTAVPGKPDPTINCVRRIVAASNGYYEGYLMLNLYPQRATDPKGMHDVPDSSAHRKNLETIERYLCEFAGKRTRVDIWAAWGGNIKIRRYLRQNLIDIVNITKKYPVYWLQKGNYKNPHHPLYLKDSMEFSAFDIDTYLDKMSGLFR